MGIQHLRGQGIEGAVIVDVDSRRIQGLARNTDILAREEICRGAGGRRQVGGALVTRIPPQLPVLAQCIDVLWQETGFRDRVDRVEGQRKRRVILDCPYSTFRVEEILPRRPVESLAPGKRTTAL